MQGDNLKRSGMFSSYMDATGDSVEYQVLQANIIFRHKAYQNFLNKVCKSHIDFSSSDFPEAYSQCVEKTLSKLAPLAKGAEKHYDELHSNKYNMVIFLDYLKQLDKENRASEIRRENEETRFGSNSFFDKFRTVPQ